MIRALVACTATLCLFPVSHAQPARCKIDDQCEGGFYCVPDAFVCRKCLDCVELKRDPPRVASPCIKSIIDCGSCIKGLVEDLRGDVSSECVPPDARDDDAALPAYVWVILFLGLLLFCLLVVAIVVYILRNTDTFKILASTRTSVQSPCTASGVDAEMVASAPELPPPYAPYHAHYTAVRPSSPPPDAPANYETQHPGEESQWPFIKRAPTTRVSAARESAGSQAARVYSNPSYVRGPHLPPGYEGLSAEAAGVGAAPSDDERDAFAHDEDTMESPWTPADRDQHAADANMMSSTGSESTGAELSSLLAAARGTELLCARQDTNNNRSASDTLDAGESSANGPTHNVPSLIINTVKNIDTETRQSDEAL